MTKAFTLDPVFYYAGIGSRRINKQTSYIMMRYACAMALSGGCLRTGAAGGSDTSFEVGAMIAYDAISKKFGLPPGRYAQAMEVYLPWKGFSGRKGGPEDGYLAMGESKEAQHIAETHHPSWNSLGRAARSMMCRNGHQVLGKDLQSPSRFVICSTPDGAISHAETSSKTGGTGQAIRVASTHGVPVYNIARQDHLLKVMGWLETSEMKIQQRLGLSPKALVDDYLANYKGIEKTAEGDLVKMALDGEFDVIVHGVNCQGKMNSGIAKTIRETFPEVYESYMRHKPGNKKLLGTIDVVSVERNGRTFHVINAFTQFNYGRNENELYVDYEAIRNACLKIKEQFGSQVRIGLPRIGAGLGNGCWVTISKTITAALDKHNLTLVDYSGPETFSELKREAQGEEKEQLSFF